jgi:hypothetical protein
MNDSRPTVAGREETPGGRHSERSASPGHDDELRAEIIGRAIAILAELQADLPDWETIGELALGAHERIETAT